MSENSKVSSVMQTFSIQPIGVFSSRIQRKYDAPHQGNFAYRNTNVQLATDNSKDENDEVQRENTNYTSKDGVIRLFKQHNFEQALSDVQGFERLWVIYLFHKNIREEKAQWKPKVLPPRGRIKRGVFATRAPYRPNPLGISVVRLLSVQGLMLHVGDCDVLDGTPILDIKPYIPLYDSFPESRTGWLEKLDERLFTCEYSSEAALQLASADVPTLDETLRRVLSIDPFPHPYRRIRALDEAKQEYEYAYQIWRVRYRVDMERRHILIASLFNTVK